MARESLCSAAKERIKERARASEKDWETQREKLQGNKGNNGTEREEYGGLERWTKENKIWRMD